MSPASRGKRTDPERRDWIESSKKRRSSTACASDAAAAPAAAVFEGPDSWACMNEDLLRLVAWRVLAGEFADYIRLRAVSRHWRSSTVCPRGRGVVDPRFHPRHWRMLPEGYRLYPDHTKLSGRARFFNLRTGSFASVCLPLFGEHLALDSVDGLLVVHRVHDTAVRLLHPFTGDIVELPLLSTLLPQLAPLVNPDEFYIPEDTHDYIVELTREIVAAVSFSPNGAITAMLAFQSGYVSRVAFATSEDQQWTLSSWGTGDIESTIPFQGKLYFCNEGNQVFVVDPHLQEGKKELGSPPAPSSLPPPKLIATFPSGIHDPYLVECDAEVLLVGCVDFVITHVEVYRIADAILGSFTPLQCIGDNSLFMAPFRSMCVSSKAHPSIVGDTVITTNPSFKHIVQYHLRSSTWSIASDGDIYSASKLSPFSLIRHIHSCCFRSF